MQSVAAFQLIAARLLATHYDLKLDSTVLADAEHVRTLGPARVHVILTQIARREGFARTDRRPAGQPLCADDENYARMKLGLPPMGQSTYMSLERLPRPSGQEAALPLSYSVRINKLLVGELAGCHRGTGSALRTWHEFRAVDGRLIAGDVGVRGMNREKLHALADDEFCLRLAKRAARRAEAASPSP